MRVYFALFALALFAASEVPLFAAGPGEDAEVEAIIVRSIQEVRASSGLSTRFAEYDAYWSDFLHRLQDTEDREVRRQFVLSMVCNKAEAALSALEENEIREGKGKPRKMTTAERSEATNRVSDLLIDLARLDPADSHGVVSRLKARFEKTKK